MCGLSIIKSLLFTTILWLNDLLEINRCRIKEIGNTAAGSQTHFGDLLFLFRYASFQEKKTITQMAWVKWVSTRFIFLKGFGSEPLYDENYKI